MERSFSVNAPSVVSEVIDGEAVIMDLKNGNYYSSLDTGRVLWEWAVSGYSEQSMIAGLSARYDGDDLTIAAATRRFLEELIGHGLIVVSAANNGRAGIPPVMADAPRLPFTIPQLSAYSDMQDLILLDPIHDVDDAGWPQQKPAAGA